MEGETRNGDREQLIKERHSNDEAASEATTEEIANGSERAYSEDLNEMENVPESNISAHPSHDRCHSLEDRPEEHEGAKKLEESQCLGAERIHQEESVSGQDDEKYGTSSLPRERVAGHNNSKEQARLPDSSHRQESGEEGAVGSELHSTEEGAVASSWKEVEEQQSDTNSFAKGTQWRFWQPPDRPQVLASDEYNSDDSESRPYIKYENLPTEESTGLIDDFYDETLEDSNDFIMRDPARQGVLSRKYESLDYDPCENDMYKDEQRSPRISARTKFFIRMVMMAAIGLLTGCIAAFIDIAIDQLSNKKYTWLKGYVDKGMAQDCLWLPFLMWVVLNVGPVLIASLLVVYLEPVAGGSGIPQVKCYLNGVKVPRVVRIKTLVVKVLGVICSVVGGLAVGKEGPMIHSGAVVAAGISQGKSTTFPWLDLHILKFFREDHEKRDFVSGGAAAGVAAAFGAPVGGVLFSLEEGASFWNQALTWNIFFCSMISSVSLNMILSAYHGVPGQLAYTGLLNFGKFQDLSYKVIDTVVFVLMGAIGGALGAIFNHMNHKVTVFRKSCIKNKLWHVFEAALVAAATAAVGFLLILITHECVPLGGTKTDHPLQMFCGDGEYSNMGALWFQTPEASVRSLFHDPPGSDSAWTLAPLCVVYFIVSCVTYGLSVPSGLFIPALLTGALWGRMLGLVLHFLIPSWEIVNHPGKFALIGAAAQLGGVVRMTISLTVIMIEATGDIVFGLPIMITLMVAKYVGDYFNEGIYDMHIKMMGVPFLEWHPPPLSIGISAKELMSYPVVTLPLKVKVRQVMEILKSVKHNGFPVVEHTAEDEGASAGEDEPRTYGTFRGLILRSHLVLILQKKYFMEDHATWLGERPPNVETFRSAYPRYPTIDDVELDEQDLDKTLNLEVFMNMAPYTVQESASLPRVFRLFRAEGLRHLVVVETDNKVVGIVTRIDIAKYRICGSKIVELRIADSP